MKRLFVNPDWTLISLGMYFTLPVVWWVVIHRDLPVRSDVLAGFGISMVVWIVALIFHLLSPVSWQKALWLQLGLMLAPSTIWLISYIFWNHLRPWVVASQFSPRAVNSVYFALGLVWIGLMFAPALIPLLLGRAKVRNAFLVIRSVVLQMLDDTYSWSTLLAWVLATFAGVALAIILGNNQHAFWWATPLPLGILQGLVLRRYWDKTEDWFIATMAGLICGVFLASRFLLLDLYIGSMEFPAEVDPIFIWSTIGTVLGLSQWLVLRSHVSNAYWWIVVNMIVGLVGGYLSVGGVIGLFVMGILLGIVTGFVLVQFLSGMDTLTP
jgi:hypothetical protein